MSRLLASLCLAACAAAVIAAQTPTPDVPVIDATVTTIQNVRFPQGLAVNRDGSLLYVSQTPSPTVRWTNGIGCQEVGRPPTRETGSVAIFDTRNWAKVADSPEPGTPIHAELNSANGRVYVAVSPVGVSTYEGTTRVAAAAPIGGSPHDIGIDPGLGLGLVTNTFDTTNIDTNQTFISLMDLTSGRIQSSSNTNAFGPHKAAVDPVRHQAYVSHAVAPGAEVVDMRTGNILRRITTGLMRGGAQNAIDLARDRLYVEGDNHTPRGRVIAIDLATERAVGEAVLPAPHSVRTDPATGLVWVPMLEAGALHSSGGMVAVIDPDTMTERVRVRVGHCPYYIDFDVARRLAFVTNESDSSVSVIDLTKVPDATPSLPAPASLSSSVQGTSVGLSWPPVNGAASYLVEAGSRSGWSDIRVSTTTALGVTVDLGAGTHYVRVRAKTASGAAGSPTTEAVVVVSR